MQQTTKKSFFKVPSIWTLPSTTAPTYGTSQLFTNANYQTTYPYTPFSQRQEPLAGSLTWQQQQEQYNDWQDFARRARQQEEEQNRQKIFHARLKKFFTLILGIETLYLGSEYILPPATQKMLTSFESHVISNSKNPRTLSYKINRILKEKNYPALEELIYAELNNFLNKLIEFTVIRDMEQKPFTALTITPEIMGSLFNAIFICFTTRILCKANNDKVGLSYINYYIDSWITNVVQATNLNPNEVISIKFGKLFIALDSKNPKILSFYLNLYPFTSAEIKQRQIERLIVSWVTLDQFKGSPEDKEMLNILINIGKNSTEFYDTETKQNIHGTLLETLDSQKDQRLIQKLDQYFQINQK